MLRRLTILAAAIVGLHLCQVATLGIKPPGPLFAELLEAIAAALAAVLCFAAFGRSRGISRPFWLLVGLALASQCVTDLAWAYYEGWAHVPPAAVTVVRILPFVRILFLAMVLFLDPEDDSSPLGSRSLIDCAQITIVFVLIYLLVYNREQSPGQLSSVIREIWVAEAERAVLIALAIVQIIRARRPQARVLYRGLFLYLWWYLFAEGAGNYVLAIRGTPSGTPLDLVWTLPSLGIALWAGSWSPVIEAPSEPIRRPKKIGELLLTNATFASAPLLVLLQVTQLGAEWQLLRYSLLAASILCFAARLGLSEYRQSNHLETLRRQKLATDSAKEELDVQKAALDRLIESAPEAIAIVDSLSIVLRINREFTRLFGYTPDEARGRNLDKLIVPPHRSAESIHLTQAVESGKTASLETTRQRKDGTEIDVSALVAPVTFLAGREAMYCIYRDISERKRVENQLQQSQKMEAVGRLAGGVAHDFNNLLTVINGYGDLLLQTLAENDPVREPVEQIRTAGEQAAQLSQRLLVFSRQQVVQPRPTNVSQLVADSEKMFKRLIGEDIYLVVNLAPSVEMVMADAGQIHQILMNLVVNARDAMPNGGTLVIETSRVNVSAGDLGEDSTVAPGPFVLLAVTDTGTGIDPGILQFIFEPFFTTKEPGKGTGLGLSTVYGIVRQNGGFTRVDSEPDRGTTFKVYLPVADAGVPGAETSSEGARSLRGSETVLVVEDQEDVCELVVRTLRSYGYSVFRAASGNEALLIASERSEPIHLLLTDVVMPGINGKALAENLKLSRPETKVLYMSGYLENAIVRQNVIDSDAAYIPKPFAPEALAAKVREVLNTHPSRTIS